MRSKLVIAWLFAGVAACATELPVGPQVPESSEINQSVSEQDPSLSVTPPATQVICPPSRPSCCEPDESRPGHCLAGIFCVGPGQPCP